MIQVKQKTGQGEKINWEFSKKPLLSLKNSLI